MKSSFEDTTSKIISSISSLGWNCALKTIFQKEFWYCKGEFLKEESHQGFKLSKVTDELKFIVSKPPKIENPTF